MKIKTKIISVIDISITENIITEKMSSPSTTESILSYNSVELTKDSDVKYRTILNKEISEQKSIEHELLNKKRQPLAFNSEIVDRLSNLNASAFKKEVTEKFYDPAIMAAAMALSNAITIPWGVGNLAKNERIREWLSSFHQIGEESVSGYALRADLKSGSPLDKSGESFFVVKSPRDPKNGDELVHEVIVGLYALNQMRMRGVPNFAIIYGSFECSSPFIDSVTKNIVAFCNNDKSPVTYALYESIDSTGSFTDLCVKCTSEIFMQHYFPVILAIRDAFHFCQFTHYDLHTENVINRRVSKTPFYIPYSHSKGTIWIRSEGDIPTIIDYGMSHVTLLQNNVETHYGHVSYTAPLRYYGISRDAAHPLHDAYKLLCMSLSAMKKSKNIKTYDSLKGLLKYFNTVDTPDEIIRRQEVMFYFLPLDVNTEKLSIDTYIDYLEENFDMKNFVQFTPPSKKDFQTLTCSSDGMQCVDFNVALANIGIDLTSEPNVPKTFLELYDFISSRRSNSEAESDEKTRRVLVLFDKHLLRGAIQIELQRLKAIYELLSTRFNFFNLPLDPSELLNENVLAASKRFVSSATQFLDTYQRLELANRIYTYFSEFTDPSFLILRKDVNQKIEIFKPFQLELTTHLLKQYYQLHPKINPAGFKKEDYDAIKRVYGQVSVDIQLKRYQWYWIMYSNTLNMVMGNR